MQEAEALAKEKGDRYNMKVRKNDIQKPIITNFFSFVVG
jgi:hypothetical protein